jgi:hypothetical protein
MAAAAAANISNLSPSRRTRSGASSLKASANPIIPNPMAFDTATVESEDNSTSICLSILNPDSSISL